MTYRPTINTTDLPARVFDAVAAEANASGLPTTIWRNMTERCWERSAALCIHPEFPLGLQRVTILPDCWWD